MNLEGREVREEEKAGRRLPGFSRHGRKEGRRKKEKASCVSGKSEENGGEEKEGRRGRKKEEKKKKKGQTLQEGRKGQEGRRHGHAAHASTCVYLISSL